MCVRPKGLSFGTDNPNIHEVPTQCPERTMKAYLEKHTDTPREAHRFITLVTDARRIARVNMIPPPVLLQDYQSCTDGDTSSVADKDDRIKGYAKSSFKFRERNFIFSLNRVAFALELLFNLIPHIVLYDTYLKFKERFGTRVDVTEYRKHDTIQIINRSDSLPIYQVTTVNIYSSDRINKTVDINHMKPWFTWYSNGYG